MHSRFIPSVFMKSIAFVLLGLAAWFAIASFAPPESRKMPSGDSGAAARATVTKVKERKDAADESTLATDKVSASRHRDEALEAIGTAAASYVPDGVKAIRPWLLDADPEIRMAARDGMVQLGEADAIPWLRDAAGKLRDPAEIAAFHEAADLLALPPWSETAEARSAVAEIIEANTR